jgi:hypothetical protein
MNRDQKTDVILALITVAFTALAIRFARVPARPGVVMLPPIVPPEALAIVPGTVRISAGQLIRSGGDVRPRLLHLPPPGQPPEIKFDDRHRIILPKEHADLIISMRNCAECHPPNDPVKLEYDATTAALIVPAAHQGPAGDGARPQLPQRELLQLPRPNQLDQLHTAEGTKLKFDQATLLCAGCHGPTYRDWEAGVHGRTSGYWDRSAGPDRAAGMHLLPRSARPGLHRPHPDARTPSPPSPEPTPMPAEPNTLTMSSEPASDGMTRRSFLRTSAVSRPAGGDRRRRAWRRCASSASSPPSTSSSRSITRS